MLTKRMLINNKSAVRYSVGTLDDYRLCFSGSSNFWKGATANIIPSENVSLVLFKLDFHIIVLDFRVRSLALCTLWMFPTWKSWINKKWAMMQLMFQ